MRVINQAAKNECYCMLKSIIVALVMVAVGTTMVEQAMDDVDKIIGVLFVLFGMLTNLFVLAWSVELRVMYKRWEKEGAYGRFKRPYALR